MPTLLPGAKCETAPRSVLASISMHRGGAGGGVSSFSQQAAMLSNALLVSTRNAMSGRTGTIIRMAGPNEAIVAAPGCTTGRRVRLGMQGVSYLEGNQVMIGENPGSPGEVILGQPPNCQTDASQTSPLEISSTKRFTIPVHCPTGITSKEYIALGVGGTPQKLYAWLYVDGTPQRKLAEIEVPTSLLGGGSIDDILYAWRVPDQWFPDDGAAASVSLEIDTGDLTFTASSSTVHRATGDWASDGARAGSRFVVQGVGSNNGTFTIQSIDGADVIVEESLTNEGPVTPSNVSLEYSQYGAAFTDCDVLVLWVHDTVGVSGNAYILTWRIPSTGASTLWVRDIGDDPFHDVFIAPYGWETDTWSSIPQPAVFWIKHYYDTTPSTEINPSGGVACRAVEIHCGGLVPPPAMMTIGAVTSGGPGAYSSGTFEPADGTLAKTFYCVTEDGYSPLFGQGFHWVKGAIVAWGYVSAIGYGYVLTTSGSVVATENLRGGNNLFDFETESCWIHDGRALKAFDSEPSAGSQSPCLIAISAAVDPLWPAGYSNGYVNHLSTSPNGREYAVYSQTDPGGLLRLLIGHVPDASCSQPLITVDDLPSTGLPPVLMLART